MSEEDLEKKNKTNLRRPFMSEKDLEKKNKTNLRRPIMSEEDLEKKNKTNLNELKKQTLQQQQKSRNHGSRRSIQSYYLN